LRFIFWNIWLWKLNPNQDILFQLQLQLQVAIEKPINRSKKVTFCHQKIKQIGFFSDSSISENKTNRSEKKCDAKSATPKKQDFFGFLQVQRDAQIQTVSRITAP
jgi:hypothetical protein